MGSSNGFDEDEKPAIDESRNRRTAQEHESATGEGNQGAAGDAAVRSSEDSPATRSAAAVAADAGTSISEIAGKVKSAIGGAFHWMAPVQRGIAAEQRRKESEARIQAENETTRTRRLANDQSERANKAMAELSELVSKYDQAEGQQPQQAAAPGMDDAMKDPKERVGYGLYQNSNLMKNPQFLNDAGRIFLKHGLQGGVAWVQDAEKAGKEGYTDALKRAVAGDLQGAEAAFNANGQARIQPGSLQWADEKKTTITGKYADGREFTVNPAEQLRTLLSPEEYLKRSQGDYFAGRNEANVRGREVSADARVEAAGLAADARRDAAETNAASRVEAAGIRGAGGRGTRRSTGGGTGAGTGAGGDVQPRAEPYGGSKGQAKWTSDLETHYMPKRPAKNKDGSAVVDKNGVQVQEVDEEAAGVVRDLARVNARELNAAGIHPQEASQTFTQFARAFEGGDRAKAFAALDRQGKIAIAEDKQGNPVKAVGVMGQYKDRAGQVRPIFFNLPAKMSDELVAQEAQNRIDKQTSYRNERGWSPRAKPVTPPPESAADFAARGIVQY